VAENLVVYTVVHQPRRLKLPAQVIPPKTGPDEYPPYLFDEDSLGRAVARIRELAR